MNGALMNSTLRYVHLCHFTTHYATQSAFSGTSQIAFRFCFSQPLSSYVAMNSVLMNSTLRDVHLCHFTTHYAIQKRLFRDKPSSISFLLFTTIIGLCGNE